MPARRLGVHRLFLLAAAGLLEGKRAVTHWTYCNELQRLYPETQVKSDAIYVKDGNVWTSAGVTTGIDLALAMIEEDLGRDLAMLVARILVVYLRRTGGQSQYSVLLAAQSGPTPTASPRSIAGSPRTSPKICASSRLAEKAGMSARNFARRYAEARKMTPARAVEALRVDAAKRALEETDERMPQIAQSLRLLGRRPDARRLRAPGRDFTVAYRTRFAARAAPAPAPTRRPTSAACPRLRREPRSPAAFMR